MGVLELDVLRIEKGEILDSRGGIVGGHKLSIVGIGSKSFPSDANRNASQGDSPATRYFECVCSYSHYSRVNNELLISPESN
jgi:hypothetical protein